MELRDYQEKLIEDIRCQFRNHKRVLAVSPTGSGKTATTAAMIKRTIEKGGTALFTVHRQELMDQSIEEFNEQGISHGCIAAGHESDFSRPVQIASIETLRRRLGKIEFKPSLVVIDEAAHSCSSTWSSVIDHYQESYVVGLTATPERLDGKGLGGIYSTMVEGPTTDWLIRNNFLSKCELYAPEMPNLDQVKTRMGDYASDQLAGVMDDSRITGCAIREYTKHCQGSSGIAFCVSIEHSKKVAQQFTESGITAVHLDGNTPKSERRSAVGSFKRGEIKILTSVDLFSEGFNLPSVEAIIGLRPTQSLSMYLQQIGRGLRLSNGKTRAVILDHAGNAMRHGLPDDERNWSLQGREKKKKSDGDTEVKVRRCKECYMTHRPSPICPSCGYVYPVTPREVEEVDGDLVAFKRGETRSKFDSGIANAKSREQLEELAVERGYKSPTVWAEIRLAARESRKPDYRTAMMRRKIYA